MELVDMLAEYYDEDDYGNMIDSDEAYGRVGITEKEIRTELDEVREDIQALQDSYYHDVYQWYIVSENGADLCKEAGQIVYYNEALDLYLWGVTHYGTSWDYVLTDIRCNTANKEV